MDRTGMNTLTQRELAVIAVLADGLTDHEIEERLGLPPVTAAAIVEQLVLWLGVPGRTQVTKWARTLELPVSVTAMDETAPDPSTEPPSTRTPLRNRWWWPW
jgi:DNA-binding CsgD family transcriptional regulator